LSSECGEGRRGWRWRPKSTRPAPEARLLYEPGNRGDVLKAAWLLPIAEALGSSRSGAAIIDVCAGAPSYPLTDPARSRRARCPDPLAQALRAAAGEDQWPASGLFAASVCAHAGATVRLSVFDRDCDRRAAWAGLEGVEVLTGEDGAAILTGGGSTAPPQEADLVLIDPYDFFHRWGHWRSAIEAWAPRVPVLVYIYDKSLRGAGHVDQAQRLRAALASLAPARPRIGRLAADSEAPRGVHEVWLLAPEAIAERWSPALREATEAVAARFTGEIGRPNFEE